MMYIVHILEGKLIYFWINIDRCLQLVSVMNKRCINKLLSVNFLTVHAQVENQVTGLNLMLMKWGFYQRIASHF